MSPAEREARWREPVLDALALVRASITYDREAQRVLLAHSEPDRVRDWLLTSARCWLLERAGLREVGADAAVEAALDYLDRLTAGYLEDAAQAPAPTQCRPAGQARDKVHAAGQK